jgi:hypothetical protein
VSTLSRGAIASVAQFLLRETTNKYSKDQAKTKAGGKLFL